MFRLKSGLSLEFNMTLFEQMRLEMASGVHYKRASETGTAYLSKIADRHVAPTQMDKHLLDHFDEPFPENIGQTSEILDMLERFGDPNTMAQTGGRFFGLVNGSVIPASLAARLLADHWDQNSVLHAISPVNAKLEDICEQWLVDIFNLPPETAAGFVSGTSMATLCGLAAARYRILIRQGWDVNRKGLNGAPPIRIVSGRHAHSTVLKTIAMLGFGTESIEWVEVDSQGRLRTDKLPELDEYTILILQAGNVNSGAFDPIREACELARSKGAWVHIDGAFGLWAAVATGLRQLTDGIALADSWSVDGHKTLNTPYDSGIVLCKDREALVKALQNSAAYIMFSKQRDGMLYTPEMSRRARAIDLWAALRYLGREGLDALVTHLHSHAVQFSEELGVSGFEVVNEVVFNQVMIRVGDEKFTRKFVSQVQASGETWVGSSQWFGEPVVRISVCSWVTTADDVTRAVTCFQKVRSSMRG